MMKLFPGKKHKSASKQKIKPGLSALVTGGASGLGKTFISEKVNLGGLQLLLNQIEFRWKVVPTSRQSQLSYLEKKQLSVNDGRLSSAPPPSRWKKKIDSPVVEAPIKLKKVILESAILTTVVVLSLTLYTFWAAKKGYDFNFLRPFLFGAVIVLIVFAMIQVSSVKESRSDDKRLAMLEVAGLTV